ncbi:hypothetical protein HMPREF1872_00823 [Amygdalobacter nucleatus]|uniref:Uncharacterized protein n=1 Tax=Amygdalobacter nucleatus TaxID=3029274 RepID=A0A133YC79_9FIRM|nr:hypothetical protein HMPREF1872_00823 [Amygdalobacter nucleatus]
MFSAITVVVVSSIGKRLKKCGENFDAFLSKIDMILARIANLSKLSIRFLC